VIRVDADCTWRPLGRDPLTEHGIKERNGFAAERYTLPVDAAVAVPARLAESAVLVEAASVVAKAWDHIDHLGRRAASFPERVLVTGAGESAGSRLYSLTQSAHLRATCAHAVETGSSQMGRMLGAMRASSARCWLASDRSVRLPREVRLTRTTR